MPGQDESPISGGRDAAQRAADRLALVLEDVGFDVGRAFPLLGSSRGRSGAFSVELGRITPEVADQLSAVLADAARLGVTVSAGGG